jgi:hypothetical protein
MCEGLGIFSAYCSPFLPFYDSLKIIEVAQTASNVVHGKEISMICGFSDSGDRKGVSRNGAKWHSLGK